jgi:hypothetical protein
MNEAQQEQTAPFYEFGPFRVDTVKYVLTREGPFRVTNFESPSRMILPEVSVMEMALAADRIVLPIMEVSGGIWILENVGR